MKKRVVMILVAVLAVTASLAAYYRTAGGDAAPAYTTAPVTRGDVVETVEATGTLQAVTTVQVGTQVSGTIQSLHADFNSQVHKGQVIARLDPSLLQAQVDQAEATIVRLQAEVERSQVALEDAEVKLRRAQQLLVAQLIPAIDVENAQATVSQAKASVKSARAQVTQAMGSLNQNRVNLSHSIITAPVDGIVISRNVDVGQTVAASMSAPTLFVLAKDLTEMQVNASIDEADIGRIKAGQAVTFRVDAYPRDVFHGTVSQVRLEPTVAQNVVSYVTVIDVPNKELKLKPGMTANVTIEIERADNVLRVPNAALRFRPAQATAAVQTTAQGAPPQAGQTQPAPPAMRESRTRGAAVWVLRDGQLLPVPVRPSVSDGTMTAIVDGELAESAQVVTGNAVAKAGTAPIPASSSPFMPQRPGANRPGANRQGAGR
jgi:HlyD family secretion protein